MPAYFSVVFELNESKTVIRDFCKSLVDCGLVFKSGYLGFEKELFKDIISWNQNALDDSSFGFKQMLFFFSDFSEVRLYISGDRSYSTLNFNLIILNNFTCVKKEKKT